MKINTTEKLKKKTYFPRTQDETLSHLSITNNRDSLPITNASNSYQLFADYINFNCY